MGGESDTGGNRKKRTAATDRPLTSGLFLLRCVELGLNMRDLEDLDVGMVYDMMIEKANDSAEYDTIATQADFDRF